jgi:hypothetical protein
MTLKARITAIDRFIKGCREDGIYDDLNACCVMAGWDSLAGALTPLKGAAPTNNGLSVYDRGIGIAGDGSSDYLDVNRLSTADDQNDAHFACYASVNPSATAMNYMGYLEVTPSGVVAAVQTSIGDAFFQLHSTANVRLNVPTPGGLIAASRNSGSSFYAVAGQDSGSVSDTSVSQSVAKDYFLFRRNYSASPQFSDATLSFYSIGSSLGSDPATGLAALDARVSTLMADLRAIEEAGFDASALAYIRNVEEADGAYLETSVKVAINNLVSGLKSDGLWESMASTCLLCGPRTLAGALVPLRGDAPTAQGGWASGDYDRATGLTGDGNALYLDSNFPADSTDDDDHHIAVYVANGDSGSHIDIGYTTATSYSQIFSNASNNLILYYLGRNSSIYSPSGIGQGNTTGLIGLTSDSGSSFDFRFNQTAGTAPASASQSLETLNYFVFARNNNETPDVYSQSKLSFYSAGTSLDLAKLDTHISDYVTAIGAAL